MATIAKKETKKTTVNADVKTASNKPAASNSNGAGETVETKHDKFKRLATRRYKVIVKALDGFGNLGNRNAYGYTDEQIEKIFAGIENALRASRAKFSKAEEKKDYHISL